MLKIEFNILLVSITRAFTGQILKNDDDDFSSRFKQETVSNFLWKSFKYCINIFGVIWTKVGR